MFFKFKLLNIFKNMFIGVIAEGVELHENNFFQVYHIFQPFHHPNFFLSPFSPFSSLASVLAPSFSLLSCLIHKDITHTQTHIHTYTHAHMCTQPHPQRYVCVIICLSVLSVYASIKRHFGPQMRQSIFVLCLAYSLNMIFVFL